MKKLLPIALFSAFMLILDSCQQDDSLNIKSLDQILNGKDYAVNRGMLVVKDRDVLTKLVKEFDQKSNDELDSWEKSIGHKSIQRIFNEVDKKENLYLESLVTKFGDDPTLTREKIGYTPEAQELLSKKVFIIDDEGMLDMNVTSTLYARLVNEQGLIRVGNHILQYCKDYVKTILNPEEGQFINLDEITESNQQVFVYSIGHRSSKTKMSSRTQLLLGSCDQVADKYRVIGYEDLITTAEGGFPCQPVWNDYSIRIRSLKKILGTWQNYNTNFNVITYSYVAWAKNCDGSDSQNIGNAYSTVYNCPFGNTTTKLIFWNYDTGACTNTSPSCAGQPRNISFTLRNSNVQSYNNNQCYLINVI